MHEAWIVAAVLAAFPLLVAVVGRWARAAERAGPQDPPEDPWEIAYLTGGAGRVADLALFLGHQSGNLRLDGSEVRPADRTAPAAAQSGAARPVGARPTGPREQSLLAWLERGPRDIPRARADLMAHPMVNAIDKRLIASGMLRSPVRWPLWRTAAIWAALAALAAGLCVIFADWPVTGLAGRLALGGLALVVFVACLAMSPEPGRLTPAGEKARLRLTAEHPRRNVPEWDAGAGSAGPATTFWATPVQLTAAVLFALYGTEALAGSALQSVLAAPAAPAAEDAGNSGGGCGGGCGGGGCGGCGCGG